jgi:hypothetical protein
MCQSGALGILTLAAWAATDMGVCTDDGFRTHLVGWVVHDLLTYSSGLRGQTQLKLSHALGQEKKRPE